MQLNTRATRRGLTAAAMTGAALLIPAIALAAPGRPAAPAAAAPPHCPTTALTAWLGVPGNGYAGGAGYQLELSNISHQACTLYGYPGVSALGGGSVQLGSAATRVASHPNQLITLNPGATAHVELRITNVGNYPSSACHPANAVALRVYPPNDYTATEIPFSFRACAKSGPAFLHVTTTLNGTGIPGFSA
ncbi:MAG TPA: DUF4232 domain-containing protein [Streptosporangiaceae bacterium]|jgi:hypothetical protein|nr:DUF4232 domain-containing protein [Streptosporangiaceae bacterium]